MTNNTDDPMRTASIIPAIALLIALSHCGVAAAQEEKDNMASRAGIYVSGNGITPDDSTRHSTWGIGLHYGQPLEEFADVLDKGFLGMGAQVAFHMGELPLDAGFGLGWDWLNRSTEDVAVRRSSLPDTTR